MFFFLVIFPDGFSVEQNPQFFSSEQCKLVDSHGPPEHCPRQSNLHQPGKIYKTNYYRSLLFTSVTHTEINKINKCTYWIKQKFMLKILCQTAESWSSNINSELTPNEKAMGCKPADTELCNQGFCAINMDSWLPCARTTASKKKSSSSSVSYTQPHRDFGFSVFNNIYVQDEVHCICY